MRCDGPSRHRQCGHSASCDDYRRTSTPRDVVCNTARLDTTHFTGRTHWVGRTRRCSGTEDTEKPARSPEPCAVVAATPTARPARAQAVTRSRRQRRAPSCRGARRSRRAKGGLQPAARSRSAAGRAHKNAPPLDVSAASKATDATSDMRDATVRRLDGSLRPQGQPRRPP